MEMPMDVLNKRLGKIRDNGDIDFDNTAAAVSIDEELQEKFIFFPREEVAAVEIDTDLRHQLIYAGDGPEEERAGLSANPDWLYNRALHCMALYQHLKEHQRLEEEQRRIAHNRQVIINRRPAPGVYMLHTGGEVHLTVVTAERNIFFKRSRTDQTMDVTAIFDGLESKAEWTFTPIQTGLSA